MPHCQVYADNRHEDTSILSMQSGLCYLEQGVAERVHEGGNPVHEGWNPLHEGVGKRVHQAMAGTGFLPDNNNDVSWQQGMA